jgi:amidase
MNFSAFTNDCLGRLDATAITQCIAKGEFTIEDALAASIERARKSQPVIHGLVVTDFDRVTERSKRSQADLRHSKLNAPSVLKDNLRLEGLPTRHGSKATPARPDLRTDGIVGQMQACGLHFIGKSALPPFGLNCSTEFDDGTLPTRNPWNLQLSAGGSSGGSAALVAAGVVPIAHGNDGGGSLRIPSAMCGVIGLKPSRGRLVTQSKVKFLPVNIIADGVITRSIRDQANFFFEAEKHYSNPGLKPIGEVKGPGVKKLRIGFYFDSVFTKACEETRGAVERTVAALSAAGHHVEQTSIPSGKQFADDFVHYWCVLAFGVEMFGPLFFGGGAEGFNRKNLDRWTKGLSKNFRKGFWQNLGAIRRLRRSESVLGQHFSKYDAVISPVLAKVTPPVGLFDPNQEFEVILQRLREYVGYTPMENVLGNPAMSLPLGKSLNGEPIGVQISCATGNERTLLELGFELEAALGWPLLMT